MQRAQIASWFFSLLLASTLLLNLTPSASAQPPADLTIQTFATGFNSAIAVRHAGDGSGRLFVVEQAGVIKVVSSAGTVSATPFLDITGLVASGGEMGLLGLAFHPDYENNGYFYVNYTRDTPTRQTVVARYSVSSENADVADSGSALIILVIDQPYSNHNGGDIHFGPKDGYLYIGMGDGGGWDTSQDLTTLLGKMLRIDVDSGSPYAVPADNPYVGNASALDEIWSSGLRNPWRWSFDRQTGQMIVGDVGEESWEEVSAIPVNTPGVNFGWPCKEGNDDFQTAFCSGMETLLAPFHVHSHGRGGLCYTVIGGWAYRGAAIPNLRGYVLFNDWCTGETWFAHQTGVGTWSVSPWNDVSGFSLVAYGEDEDGEMYLVLGGEIGKLTSASSTPAGTVFSDGFEDGDFSAWSSP